MVSELLFFLTDLILYSTVGSMALPTSPSSVLVIAPMIPPASSTNGVFDSQLFSTKKINIENSNYLWQQVLFALKIHKLQNFLNVSILPPPQFTKDVAGVTKENPDFERFEQQGNALPLGSCLLRALHSQQKGDLSMNKFLMKIKAYCESPLAVVRLLVSMSTLQRFLMAFLQILSPLLQSRFISGFGPFRGQGCGRSS
ncbi:hypothetical protein Gogos_021422, partial [Gossypium gossypioides]|nr:hypothetical protein [Gossypium gossypioides]